jgi:predicted DNA binding CopG/RHH family protein
MRGRSGSRFLILVVVTLSGCSSLPPGEAAIVEDLAVQERVATILSGIRDDDSVAAALPELKQAAERHKAIVERLVGLKLPATEQQHLQAKYKRQSEEITARVSDALTALKTKAPRQGGKLLPVVADLGYFMAPGS